MPSNGHAFLTASGSKIWLNCPPSARLAEGFEDEPTVYALEGTEAHELCEYKVKLALGAKPEELDLKKFKFYTPDMEDYASSYAAYVMEALEEIKKIDGNPQIYIEQKLDFSNYVPEAFGTGDCVIVGGNTIHVIDFKYGMNFVDATYNSQMMLYALGALNLLDMLYDIEVIKMTIYQPRIANISEFELSKNELMEWAENLLKPRAEMAFKGEGTFKAGDHCKFCKCKALCRERARKNLELARYEFRDPALLTNDDVSSILKESEDLISWLDDVKNFALSEALKGNKIPGYKLVSGRSNRKFDDENEVAKILEGLGIDPYVKKLMSLTDLEKKIGKKKFAESLSAHVVKPEGKPTLVVESDKRPELNNIMTDFAEFLEVKKDYE